MLQPSTFTALTQQIFMFLSAVVLLFQVFKVFSLNHLAVFLACKYMALKTL